MLWFTSLLHVLSPSPFASLRSDEYQACLLIPYLAELRSILFPYNLVFAFSSSYGTCTSSILMNLFRPTLLAGYRLQIQKRLPCI